MLWSFIWMILVWLLLASPFSIPGRFVLVPCDTELNNTDILIFFFLNHKKHRTLLEVNVEENQPTPHKKTHLLSSRACVCVYWCFMLICIRRLKTIFNDAMIVQWRPSPISHFACLFLYLFHACDFWPQEKKYRDFLRLCTQPCLLMCNNQQLKSNMTI